MNNSFLEGLINGLLERHADKGSSREQVEMAVRNALSIEALLNNLAEVFRLSKNDIEKDLESFGWAPISTNTVSSKPIGDFDDKML